MIETRIELTGQLNYDVDYVPEYHTPVIEDTTLVYDLKIDGASVEDGELVL